MLTTSSREKLIAIRRDVASFLKEHKLGKYLSKVWIYRDTCVVMDIVSRDIRFAFNITPEEDDLFALDIVQRTHKADLPLTSNRAGKARLCEAVPFSRALTALEAKAWDVLATIDGHFDAASAPASGSLNVGIITLPLHRNIGGILQAYALMEALRKLGHQPVLIDRTWQPTDGISPTLAVDAPLFAKPARMGKTPALKAFIENYISPISRRYNFGTLLRENIDRYSFDAVIVGSDQVWRPKYAKTLLPDFFLDFLPSGNTTTKRISYAASFGASEWEYDEDQTRTTAELVARFDAVSVRESGAVSLCRDHLGVAARHVLDPTMLHAAEHYIQKFSLASRHTGGDRLLTYILDSNSDKVNVVNAVAERLCLTPYAANGMPFGASRGPSEDEGDGSIEGWLASFHKASFIVTDSFHGAVFSILFNKPFLVYGNPARGMARFTSLMELFALEERLIVQPGDFDIERSVRPIDWSRINTRIDALRATSLGFLQSALTGRGEAQTPPDVSRVQREGDAFASQICQPLNVLCSGCGACVSEAPGALRMAWNEDGFLVPQGTSTAVPADAVKVCPFNPHPDKDVEDEDALAGLFLPDAPHFDPRAGRFENAYIGYSKAYRPTSSSGGITTYVFERLLRRGDVDHLFVVQGDSDTGYTYKLFSHADDIKSISKTRYFPVSMDELFTILDKTEGRIAVSGVACFIKAIRLKQYYHPELKARIPFLIGLICGGLKSRLYTDFLAQSAGIPGPYVQPEYRVKNPEGMASQYSFAASDDRGKRHTLQMGRVGNVWGTGLFKSKACDFCSDVLTELADISVGDAWLPEYNSDGMGNSVVVTRSALADTIVRAGIEAGDLVMDEVPIARIAQSQGGGFRHKQNTLKFRVWMAKKTKGFPIPVVRERMLRQVSIADALVQVLRERARSKSLVYWNETKTAEGFRARMRSTLNALKLKSPGDLLAAGHPMMRWVMRKVRKGQFDYDMMRAALVETPSSAPPEGSDRSAS